MESEMVRRSLTAWLPTYLQAQHFLRVVEGTTHTFFRAMRDAIDGSAVLRKVLSVGRIPMNGYWSACMTKAKRLHCDSGTSQKRL